MIAESPPNTKLVFNYMTS